jgi:ribonuclease BN (tRNA processing enzyme)
MWRWFLCLPVLAATAATAAEPCGDDGVAVQVLGSGGPQLTAKRAGSSYLLWIDGKARALIDAGHGAALRFAESGASVADLDLVLFLRLQAAHTVDLPAFVQASRFDPRDRALPLYGPPAGRGMPSTIGFVRDLFDATRGTYRHLGEFISPLDRSSYKLEPHDVREPPAKLGAARRAKPTVLPVFRNDRLRIRAVSVLDGTVPTVAYRIEAGGKTVVFADDGGGPGLAALADRADLIVVHHTIPEARAVAGGSPLPRLGEIAQAARARRLVLANHAGTTLGREDEVHAAVRKLYSGPVEFADDLSCYRP